LTGLFGAFAVDENYLPRLWVCVELIFFLSYFLPPNAAERASLSVEVVPSPLFERIQAGVMVSFQKIFVICNVMVSEPVSESSLEGFLEVNSRSSGRFFQVVLIEEHPKLET